MANIISFRQRFNQHKLFYKKEPLRGKCKIIRGLVILKYST